MKHLFRASLVVAFIFLALIVAPRVIKVPDFLSKFGFHTVDKAKNEAQWASISVQYAESPLCNSCHQDNYKVWQNSNHRTVACENCHGPAENHLSGKTVPVVDTSNELCGTCHAKLPARPASFPQVDMNKFGSQSCTSCHNPHNPLEGLPPKVPHPVDDRANCQSCHNPKESLQELPPLMPHPLEGRENCLSCHNTQPKMGNIAASVGSAPQAPHSFDGLSDCLTCHNTGGLKPFPGDHTGRSVKTCTSCHRSTIA